MALQFIDGFDHYTLSGDDGFEGGDAAIGQKWDSSFFAGEMYPTQLVGRFTPGALRVRKSGSWVQKLVPTPKNEMIVGFAFLPAATSAFTTEISFNYSDGADCTMRLELATGNVRVLSSNGNTDETVTTILTAGIWQYMEFRVKSGSSAGEVEVYHNEVQIISATSQDVGGEGLNITSLRVTGNSVAQIDHIDDLYLLDTTGATNNTFLGDSRITVLHTDGDGATNDFTMTSDDVLDLSNFQAVQDDDGNWSDRDHSYVESGLIGARETYGNESMVQAGVVAINTIHGVQVVNNCKKTATGVLKYNDEMTIAGVQYTNGVDVIASTGDYHMSTYIRDTDPSDSATWTETKVNAVGSGFTITVREI